MAMKHQKRRDRLSKDDWIEAVGATLLADGPTGLRVSRIARRLGVTPGSFYWHFRDRDQLRDLWIQHWMQKMLPNAAARARPAGRATVPIRMLPQILLTRGLPELDAAMRKWAVQDPVVAAAVARADDLRLRVVSAMFDEVRALTISAHPLSSRYLRPCSFLNSPTIGACAFSAGSQRPALMKSEIGSGTLPRAGGFGGLLGPLTAHA